MRTYPNQKIVEIMKSACDKNNEYAILNMDALHYAAKDLSATDFKLYIYLAKNKDGFDLALSKKAFMDWAGCQENTYRSAVSSLVQKGYLVQEEGHYIFTDMPSKPDTLGF